MIAKMMDCVALSKNSTVCLNPTAKANAYSCCENCDTLKSKCQKTKDELKSAQLIIELLRSEVNSNGRLSSKLAKDQRT
jgi:hypothetical protein